MGFSKEEFRDWLRNHPDRIVGRSGTSCDCPLARFITRRGSPYEHAVVSLHGTRVAMPNVDPSGSTFVWKDFSLEPWQQTFIRIVDGSSTTERRISPDDALRMLEHTE